MKSHKTFSRPLVVATAPVCLACVISSLSQSAMAAPDPGGDTGGDALETVTVTARKVAENLLKVPVAVQVLTAKDLAARDVVSFDDLSLSTHRVSPMTRRIRAAPAPTGLSSSSSFAA